LLGVTFVVGSRLSSPPPRGQSGFFLQALTELETMGAAAPASISSPVPVC
jgi:hypothetical protein